MIENMRICKEHEIVFLTVGLCPVCFLEREVWKLENRLLKLYEKIDKKKMKK